MLNRSQQLVLEAACRRIVPAAEAAGRNTVLCDAVRARIALLSSFQRRRTLRALDILGSRVLALWLVGRPLPFHRLPPHVQDRMLSRCEHSRWSVLRLLFTGLKRLIAHTWYGLPEARDEIGHHGPLTNRGVEFGWEGPLAGAQPLVATRVRGRERAAQRDAQVMRAQDIARDLSISAEFCIIGSGAGGAVAACTLSEAGRDVVIVEAGPYYTAADFATHEHEALHTLYAENGMRGTDDLAVSILQGRCAGGGTTVNWMVMLRTPDYVLDEWARDYGVENMSPAEMRPVFEQFEADTNVTTVPDHAHSRVNRLLLDGSHALGWQAQGASVNARDCMRSGLCGFGCPYDAKQSALKNYLARALRAGARMYCDTAAERITATSSGTTVFARCANGKRVVVNAKYLVLAAGAVETPALLQRSGWGNHNVGRHLRLHPTTAVVGIHSEPVYAASGIPLTTYCSEFMQWRGTYGCWIETPPFPAGLAAISMPGFGQMHRERMQQFPYLAPFIVLARDGIPADPSVGDVRWLRSGRVRIRYRLSESDRTLLVHGVESAARIQFASGAHTVFTLHRLPALLHSAREVNEVRALFQRAGDPVLFSAHVNGTCRMSAHERFGACNPEGALYGAKRMYVMDGSLLPTAPGVNPHETIAAVSLVLSRRLIALP